MGIQLQSGDGVAEIVIDFPPVNALPTQGWFDLADTLAGRRGTRRWSEPTAAASPRSPRCTSARSR